MKPEAAAKLDALLKQWAADSDEPFSVCIARHSVIVLHRAYGSRVEAETLMNRLIGLGARPAGTAPRLRAP